MARLARIVVPGLPHHVTQRGNGCAKVFFSPEDYALYKKLLVEQGVVPDAASPYGLRRIEPEWSIFGATPRSASRIDPPHKEAGEAQNPA
jgi:hypothetical protein